MFHNPRNRRLLVISALAFASCADARAAESMPLTAAVIRGSSVYTPAQLFATWRDELGRPVDGTRARAVIGAVGDLYERDGYARPEVRAEGTTPAPGIMRLTVVEPQITEVIIEGDAGPHQQRLTELSSQLERMQPIRRSEVQRVLGRMRELPGLSVVANTRRDDGERNGYALAVNAAFDPVDGVVGVSNRATEEIGPVFINGRAVANGWLTGVEKLGVVLTAATDVDEYRGIGAFVDTPVNSRGTRAFLLVFGSDAEPSTPADAPVDEYLRERATLRITHPLAVGTRVSLALAAAFDADDFQIRRDGAELREERLRVVQLGTRASWRGGERTQYDATLELRQGLDALGSGLQAEDIGDDRRRADFLLTRLQLAQVTRFGDAWSVRADVLAQHTAYALPYSERFKVGGERLGRGFEVSEIAGDRGAGAKLEVRRSFTAEAPFGLKPSAYAFYDIGATWNQDVGGRASAATGGLGVAAQAGRISGYLEVAKPLTRPDLEGKRSTSLFGGLSLRL